MRPDVVALVPAYNASATVAETVDALKHVASINRIVVIDDGSQDDTAEKATRAGAEVIRLSQNAGKGGALNAGLAKTSGCIIALVDSDLGRSASEVEKLIDPVLKERADMTIAQFPRAKRKGGFGLLKRVARDGLRVFTGQEFNSPLSGQRVLTPKAVEAIGRFESGWGVEVGLTIDACRKGLRVKEIPVEMTHGETGRDLAGFIHRGRQFLGVVRVLVGRALTR